MGSGITLALLAAQRDLERFVGGISICVGTLDPGRSKEACLDEVNWDGRVRPVDRRGSWSVSSVRSVCGDAVLAELAGFERDRQAVGSRRCRWNVRAQLATPPYE